jgi:DHA3 family multidrug efflux protein-like MFS transporter
MIAILAVPGLLGLIMFTTFNNFASGVYMALLDPYGLTMFSVEIWGIVFGLAGTGFLVGGAIVAKWGLGRNPVRTMLLLVAVLGIIGALVAIREWAWIFIAGIWLFMLLMPAIEAAEQTVIQRVVPFEKQGRVFGLAMTFEAAAAPITSLLIAPIAEFWIVPYMRDGVGEQSWSWLLGEGESRGIALIFLWAGVLTTVVSLLALLTPTYRKLSRSYVAAAPAPEPEPAPEPSA